MRKIKAVDLYMRSIIPDDISLEGVTYDKKGLGGLMAEVGDKHPKLYREISKKVLDMGRESSYMQGETITLQDMVPTFDKDSVIKQMRQEVKSVTSKIKNKDDQKKARAQIYAKYSEALQGMTMDSIKGTKHNLGNTVTSGSRGSPSQLMSMVTTPGIYTDYKNDIIDMFIENSYGEGLRPHEYLSSTFGTRKAVISTKEATADASLEMFWSGPVCRLAAFINSPAKKRGRTDAVPGRRGPRVRPHEVDPEGRLARRLRDVRAVGFGGSGRGGRLPIVAGFATIKTRGVPLLLPGRRKRES